MNNDQVRYLGEGLNAIANAINRLANAQFESNKLAGQLVKYHDRIATVQEALVQRESPPPVTPGEG